MSDDLRGLRAAIGVRVSSADADDNESVDQQEEASRGTCAEEGWSLDERYVYREKVSASRFNTSVREVWARVWADVEADRWDVLILWESSRGDRKLTSWSGFLDLCRERGKLIHVHEHRRTYDVRIPRDWRTLAEDGVDSAYEVEKTSRRVRRAIADAAVKGLPHGPTPYGYVRRYGEHNRAFISQDPCPVTAPVVRDIISRAARNEPLGAIARDLNERSVTSPSGKPWTRDAIRYIARNKSYVGLRGHNGSTTRGVWEALVDDATFAAAQRILTAPGRTSSPPKPGKTIWLLSYLLTCGTCGADMYGRASRTDKTKSYTCAAKGHTNAKAEWLDKLVTAHALERLRSMPDLYRGLAASDDAEVLAARAESEKIREHLNAYRIFAANPDNDISPEAMAVIEREAAPRIKAADDRANTLSVPLALRDLLANPHELDARWERMSVAARKVVLRTLFADLTIVRAASRSRADSLDPARVRVRWQDLR